MPVLQSANGDDGRAASSRRGFLGAALGTALVGPLTVATGTASADDTPVRPPVVDTHMHVWADDAKRYPFVHPYVPDFKGAPTPGTVEMLIEDMDQNDQTHSVLVQVIYHGWDNTYVADCVRRFPDRLVAHGLIDPEDPQAAERLTYWTSEHPIAGMRFSPIYYRGKDEWLESAGHAEVWRRAEKSNLVFNYFISDEQLPKLARLAERHPGVHVIVDHLAQIDLGKGDPEPAVQRLLAMAKYPNVSVKVSELSSVSASKQYPFADAYPWVRRVYDAFGPEKLLFGTGYPGAARAYYQRPTLADELALIRDRIPFFSDDDVQMILGANAARIWRLGNGNS
ncbi:MAG: amidohydrolase family protein [Pirellulales bacterium]|nr:amidohydrolase [Planctomycetales bacterium]